MDARQLGLAWASFLFAIFLSSCQDAGSDGSRASAALAAACEGAAAAADAEPIPDDADPNGNGGAGSAKQILERLADADPAVRSQAALRILRKAPDHGDPALLAASTVVGDLADWRADPALVRIARNRFPSSSRVFSSTARSNSLLALGAITEKSRGTPPNPGNGDGNGNDGAAPLPDYVFRAVAAAVCPAAPSDLAVRQAAVRALGQLRDPRGVELLELVRDAPSTGDDAQDRLLSFTASRALTMIRTAQ